MDIYTVCLTGAYAAFWVCFFINGFILGSGWRGLFKWAFATLGIGWLLTFASWITLGVDAFVDTMLTPYTLQCLWYAVAFVIPFTGSSLGSGYLFGRRSQKAKSNKVAERGKT